MTCSDCTAKLHDFVDHDPALSAGDTHAIEAHVAVCPACRTELASLRELRAATAALPRELTPATNLWPAIAADLGTRPSPAAWSDRLLNLRSYFTPFAVAAGVAILCSIVSPPPSWSVAATSGSPRVAARPITHDTPFRLGQWLETDATSSAKVAVGSIGEVRIEPNSRVRLAGVAAQDHRLQLARGTLDAFIWAPPRLFFVDTPSATAVDLGCAYTLTVNDDGDSELTVTAGYVALEHPGREAIVRFGNKCLTRRGIGPGTPFSITAPTALREAVEAFDFGPAAERAAALETILAHARRDDEVTLWHLLSRTTGAQLAATFDTLARVSSVPAGVTREGILAGDAAMRRTWATELGLGPF